MILTKNLNIFSIMWIMINRFFTPIKIVFANNQKEWITPKLKCLIAKRQEAHHSGRQVVRDQLAKQIKMEKRLNTNIMN